MRRILIGLLVCMWTCAVIAQQDPVLMRINNNEILRSEFEYFYQQKQSVGKKPLNYYVDLFIANKLKASVAEAAGVASNKAFREEQLAYRQQLIKSYLTDEAIEEESVRQLYEKMKAAAGAGEVQIMQIYRSLPQSITPRSLEDIQLQMASIYNAIQSDPNVDFKTLVQQYSDDKETAWVNWLQTPEEFENVVFALGEGDVSQPFFTPRGIHIVKVIKRKDFPPFEEIREKLMRSLVHQYQADKGAEAFVNKLKVLYQYTPDKNGLDELWANGSTLKPLFTLDGRIYDGIQFKQFAEAHPMGIKKQLDAFVMKSILDYENSQLEKKHPDFRFKLQRHDDQMLASAVGDGGGHRVTLADSAALKKYFSDHRSEYVWESPRYRGAALYSINKKLVKQARKLLKELPPYMWKDAIRLNYNLISAVPLVHIEQGVFAEGDNEFIDKMVFKKGDTPLTKSYPFTAVLGEKQKGPVYYREVLDELIEDYQNYLDLQWAERLRASSKVEINQEVLKTVNNH
ncbi:peptidylprolyl isomerase [Bacteroides sp.]